MVSGNRPSLSVTVGRVRTYTKPGDYIHKFESVGVIRTRSSNAIGKGLCSSEEDNYVVNAFRIWDVHQKFGAVHAYEVCLHLRGARRSF